MAVKIALENGRGETVIDGADLWLAEQFKWWVKPCGNTSYAYTVGRVRGERYRTTLHRLIMGLEPGDPRCVDHIDGNGLDNRRGNLRIATYAENARNTRKPRKPGAYRGVDRVGSQYRAKIMADWKMHVVGTFRDPIDAALAYDDAARRLHGEFAVTNFPLAKARP